MQGMSWKYSNSRSIYDVEKWYPVKGHNILIKQIIFVI